MAVYRLADSVGDNDANCEETDTLHPTNNNAPPNIIVGAQQHKAKSEHCDVDDDDDDGGNATAFAGSRASIKQMAGDGSTSSRTRDIEPVDDTNGGFGGDTEPVAGAVQMSARAICTQMLMSVLANFSILSVGMGMAFPSVSINTMTRTDDVMALEEHEFSWFASLNAIISPIGGLMVSVVLDRYGRKNTLYLINVVAILAWLTKATASRTDRDAMLVQLMIARILIGVMCGLASSPCSIYTAEISHASLRGRMSIMTPLGIASGVLFIYIVGYVIPDDWRLISFICCALSALGLIFVYFLPETPSWLVSKGRFAEAESALRFFRGQSRRLSAPNSPACRDELNTLIAKTRGASAAAGDSETLLQKFRQPGLYRPLAIMFGFFSLQQAAGLFVVVVYAAKVAQDAGITLDPFLAAVYLGCTRIVGTLAVGFLMDRFGRRVLAMCSGVVMGISMFAIAAYMASGCTQLQWLPLAMILLYFLAGSLGILTLPFTMLAEVYPQRYRGLASGLTTCVLFITSFVFTKLYPTMVSTMGAVNVFAFYGSVSLCTVLYVYYLLPETKGKTLEQIAEIFRRREPNEQLTENLMLSVRLPLNGEKERSKAVESV